MSHWQKPPLGIRLNPGHPLARGLVGCWLMNEGGGNLVRDLSSNNNNGTITVKATGSYSWVPGGLKLNRSGLEDGAYIQLGDNSCPRLAITTGNISIFALFKPGLQDATDFGTLFSCGYDIAGDDEGWMLGSCGTGGPSAAVIMDFNSANNNETDYSGNSIWTTDEWQTFSATRADSTHKMYYNGQSIPYTATTHGVTIPYLATITNYIGHLGGDYQRSYGLGYRFVDGTFGCVFIWNRLLSDSDMISLTANPYTMFEPEPFWLFQSAAGVGAVAPTGIIYGPLYGPFAGPV